MEREWYQQEFEFEYSAPEEKPVKKKRTRKPVDYDALYKLFLAGPVTFRQIEEATGVSHNAVAQVITTLSIMYPIWNPKRGVYKLLTEDDYGTE